MTVVAELSDSAGKDVGCFGGDKLSRWGANGWT